MRSSSKWKLTPVSNGHKPKLGFHSNGMQNLASAGFTEKGGILGVTYGISEVHYPVGTREVFATYPSGLFSRRRWTDDADGV